MNGAPLCWGVEGLWQQLEPMLPGLSVEVVQRVASTNSALLERARVAGPAEPGIAQVRPGVESAAFGRRAIDIQPCLMVAEHQTEGRGRQGRPWHSAPGASLTFSLGMQMQPADWAGLSLAVGVALGEALSRLAGSRQGTPRIGLKWPNDLWLMDAGEGGNGRKLGGILIETVSAGARRLAVIGVGLNIRPLPMTEPDTGVACVDELDPAATAPSTLAHLAGPLVQALLTFEREGFAAFAERFAALDVLAGRDVRTTRADVPEGVARGVSAQGALLLQTPAGMVSLASGEVSVRPVAAPVPGAAPAAAP
jgi:BirA family biotin operon repressor/biotin-[acetyl-CoA-carboxylase] ligase